MSAVSTHGLNVAKVVGTPTRNSWAQVYNFSPEGLYEQKKHGEMVAVLSFTHENEESAPSVDIGHEILTRLQEEYFGADVTDGVHKHLKSAVEKTAEEFSQNIRLEIVASVVLDEYIYLCLFGGGQVCLFREGRLATILTGKEGLTTASGTTKEGDVFILGTDALFTLISKDNFAQYLAKGLGPHDLGDNVGAIAHRQSLPALASAIFKIPPKVVESENIEEVVERAVPDVQDGQADEAAVAPKNFFKKLLISFAQKLPERNIIIKHASGSSRKTAVSVGILLLVLFTASIVFGIQQKKSQDYKSSYAGRLTEAQNAYNDAVLQKDVNPPHARELFLQAQSIVNDLVSGGVKDSAVTELQNKLQQGQATILGKVEEKPSVFHDLSLVRSGIGILEVGLAGETLIAFDTSGKRIISVATSTKETQVVGGQDKLAGGKTVGYLSGNYYVFADSGIIKMTKVGTAEVVVPKDSGWGGIVRLQGFGSNLYLLDSAGHIWRYAGTDKGFAEKQDWLKEQADFSKGRDLAIDGSLWVLEGDGKILKFTRGVRDTFSMSGLSGSFTSPTALYTDENLESIFILDAGGKRIVEVGKDGSYKKEYLAEELGSAVDLAVSKKASKIFFVTSDKIFTLDLR